MRLLTNGQDRPKSLRMFALIQVGLDKRERERERGEGCRDGYIYTHIEK